jgi:hypothetical protein
MRLPLLTTGRWMVCIAFCAICLAAGIALHWWVGARLDAVSQKAKEESGLPPDAPMEDVGIRVPNELMTWIQVDHLLMKFWFVLLPLVFLIGFGIAWSIPSKPGASRTRSTSTEKP